MLHNMIQVTCILLVLGEKLQLSSALTDAKNYREVLSAIFADAKALIRSAEHKMDENTLISSSMVVLMSHLS